MVAGIERQPASRRRKEAVTQSRLSNAKANPLQISARKTSQSCGLSIADAGKMGSSDNFMTAEAAEAERQYQPTIWRPNAVSAKDRDVRKNVCFFIMQMLSNGEVSGGREQPTHQ